MSFVEQEDILSMFEGMIKYIFKTVKGIDYTERVARMTWEEAMWQYGNDKPDIRFGMKLLNLKSAFTLSVDALARLGELAAGDAKAGVVGQRERLIDGASFGVFDKAETVLAIAVPGCSEYTRKQTDELTEWVKRPQIGMQGLVYIKYNTDGTVKSSIDKFYSEERLKAIADAAGAQPGDLILVLAGREERTRKAGDGPPAWSAQGRRVQAVVGAGFPVVRICRRRKSLGGEAPSVYVTKALGYPGDDRKQSGDRKCREIPGASL
jgi:aspartyl-tRNA synthetase